MICANCGRSLEFYDRYILAGPTEVVIACSRICMVSAFAPELSRVCVIAQWIAPKRWIPTPDEEERMRQ